MNMSWAIMFSDTTTTPVQRASSSAPPDDAEADEQLEHAEHEED